MLILYIFEMNYFSYFYNLLLETLIFLLTFKFKNDLMSLLVYYVSQ